MIMRFGSVDSAVMTSLVTAAQLLGEGCRVAHTSSTALMAELGHREGELVLYRPSSSILKKGTLMNFH